LNVKGWGTWHITYPQPEKVGATSSVSPAKLRPWLNGLKVSE